MLEDRSRADDSKKLSIWAWERDRLRRDVVEARGYNEIRRQRFWELDLLANHDKLERMARESRAQMKKEGIRLLTLAEDRDPARFDKLKRMSDEAEADVPTTVPFVQIPMDEFMKWFSSPGLKMDRIWIAREGDDIVGISMLAYPPVRGVVATDWTAMARKARGRGIARALKSRSAWAACGPTTTARTHRSCTSTRRWATTSAPRWCST